MKLRILLAMAGLSILWGSTWMASRVLVTAIPPMHSAGLRFLLAAAILLPLIVFKKLPWPTGRGLHANFILSLTMIAVPSMLIFWSERRLSSGLATMLFGAIPLIAAVLTPWIANRSVPRTAWQAMIVGIGGLGLIVSGALSTSLWQAVGALAILAAVALYAWSSVYAKESLQSVHPIVSTAIQFFLGGIWLLAAGLVFERGQPSTWSTPAILALVCLSLFASALSFTLYYWLLKQIEAYQLTSLQLIIPIVAVGEAAFFLRQSVPWSAILGAVVVVGSVVFILRAKVSDEKQVALQLEK